jgi:hypothetical protein
MTRIIFCILFLMVSGNTKSQHLKSFTLKAFTTISRSPFRDSVYLYPQFQPASITLLSGYTPQLKIKANYNLYQDRIEIINERSDTIGLENYGDVKVITIGGHTILNDRHKGYMEIIYHGPVLLGAHHQLSAPFMSQPTASFDRTFTDIITFFFINNKGKSLRASPPSILKYYPRKKQELRKYLKESPVDFKSAIDLVRLLNFCNDQLP